MFARRSLDQRTTLDRQIEMPNAQVIQHGNAEVHVGLVLNSPAKGGGDEAQRGAGDEAMMTSTKRVTPEVAWEPNVGVLPASLLRPVV